MDTIVLIDTCYSYLSFNGSSTVPYMAKAFVDYGAKSFTGSTFNVPVFLMPPNQQHGRALNSFWIRLSGARYEFYWIFFPVYGYHWVEAADESVYESGDGMCDWYNDWTYGGEDGEWQTYSDDPDYEIYLE